jgi:hypothetical protein
MDAQSRGELQVLMIAELRQRKRQQGLRRRTKAEESCGGKGCREACAARHPTS